MEIKVKGMHCEHCEAKVEKALLALGVESCKASFKEERIDVNFDENKISLEDIKKEIKNCGFKAK